VTLYSLSDFYKQDDFGAIISGGAFSSVFSIHLQLDYLTHHYCAKKPHVLVHDLNIN